MDSGASHHMMGTQELFTSLSMKDLDLHVDVEGVGTIRFQLESRGSMEVADVLYVQELKKSLLSVSTMEDRGYAITFEDSQVLILPVDLALTQHEFLVTETAFYTG
jgi:hypothetical protein